MPNKIILTVGGIKYPILTDEDENFVHKIGDELNRSLNQTAKHNPNLSTVMVAALTALDYCGQCEKLKEENRRLKKQLGILPESEKSAE